MSHSHKCPVWTTRSEWEWAAFHLPFTNKTTQSHSLLSNLQRGGQVLLITHSHKGHRTAVFPISWAFECLSQIAFCSQFQAAYLLKVRYQKIRPISSESKYGIQWGLGINSGPWIKMHRLYSTTCTQSGRDRFKIQRSSSGAKNNWTCATVTARVLLWRKFGVDTQHSRTPTFFTCISACGHMPSSLAGTLKRIPATQIHISFISLERGTRPRSTAR